MRSLLLIWMIMMSGCSDQYLKVKELVQENCEEYVDTDDIEVLKMDSYYVASILRNPSYSNIYYFLVFGNEMDDVIMVGDNNINYSINDSLYKKILYVNNRLRERGIEIEDIYFDTNDSFTIRARDTEKKYWFEVVEVNDLQDLCDINFVYRKPK